MREKPSNENINCPKSVKNINNRRKMHQNRKKYSKTVKNSLKKTSKTTENALKNVKITSKNIENSQNYSESHLKTSKTLEITSKLLKTIKNITNQSKTNQKLSRNQ